MERFFLSLSFSFIIIIIIIALSLFSPLLFKRYIFTASQVTICMLLVIEIFSQYLFVIYNVIEKQKKSVSLFLYCIK